MEIIVGIPVFVTGTLSFFFVLDAAAASYQERSQKVKSTLRIISKSIPLRSSNPKFSFSNLVPQHDQIPIALWEGLNSAELIFLIQSDSTGSTYSKTRWWHFSANPRWVNPPVCSDHRRFSQHAWTAAVCGNTQQVKNGKLRVHVWVVRIAKNLALPSWHLRFLCFSSSRGL